MLWLRRLLRRVGGVTYNFGEVLFGAVRGCHCSVVRVSWRVALVIVTRTRRAGMLAIWLGP